MPKTRRDMQQQYEGAQGKAELQGRVVEALLSGHKMPKQITTALQRWDPDLTEAMVTACWNEQATWDLYFECLAHPESSVKKRLKDALAVHRLLDGEEELASPRNDDKRTRTMNLNNALARRGFPAGSSVEHTLGDDLTQAMDRYFGKEKPPDAAA